MKSAEQRNREKSRFAKARNWLLFWTLFIGIGAVAGGLSMILDPSGKTLHMDGMLPYFQVLPFAEVLFQDLLFSGFALLIVNGLTNLTAAVLLLRKKKLGVLLGGIFGRFVLPIPELLVLHRRDLRRYPDALDLHPVLYV